MHIVVINGSPKGNRSVTLKCIEHMQRRIPGYTVEVFNVSARIRKLERNPAAFESLIDSVRQADLVLWAFPVYVLLVPAQYKRFIELVFERDAVDAFRGRPAAVFSTSIKFFDCTAHDYMRAICEDLGMSLMGTYSAEMHELLETAGREQQLGFFEMLFEDVAAGRQGKARISPPLSPLESTYMPATVPTPLPATGRRIVLLVDRLEPGTNLARMIQRTKARLGEDLEIVTLDGTRIKSGCLGCLRCGLENKCRFEDKDEFVDFYRNVIMTADVLIFAGTVKDRFFSSQWKTYFDRGFFNTHTPTIRGKQMGVLVSGPLRNLPHLRQYFEGYAEWQGANLVDIVSDEPSSSAEVDAAIDGLTGRLLRGLERGYTRPTTFLGVGGWKIFRDDIWGRLRFVFQADHKAYKQMGVYDFPQKDIGARAKNVVMKVVTTVPATRKDFLKNLTRYVVEPFEKVVDAAGPEPEQPAVAPDGETGTPRAERAA